MLSQSLAKEKALLFQVLRIFLSRSWDGTTFSENMGYQFLNRSQLLISRNKELMAIEQGFCSIWHTSQCASIDGASLLSVYVTVYFTRIRAGLSIY